MPRVHPGQLVAAMVFGVLGTLLGIGLNAAISYAQKDWANPLGIGLVVVLGSVSGILPLLKDTRPQEVADRPRPPPPQPYGGRPPRPARRLSLAVAVLVPLLLCGGGGAAAAFGVQYVGGYLTGDESGQNVLVRERSATAGDLTVTVRRVLVTAHFTIVEMTAVNGGTHPLSLPVYGNCQLGADVGPTLQADPFRSNWPETVPAKESVNGSVTFGRRLPDGATRVRISFATVYGGFGAGSITVGDLRVRSAA